jgi:hypothetical protein
MIIAHLPPGLILEVYHAEPIIYMRLGLKNCRIHISNNEQLCHRLLFTTINILELMTFMVLTVTPSSVYKQTNENTVTRENQNKEQFNFYIGIYICMRGRLRLAS